MFLLKRNIVLLVVFIFLFSVASIHAQPLSVIITPTDVICYGLCNGTATANPSGGLPPYAYQWDDSLNQTTQMATGLCAGNYSLVVTDSLGQTDTVGVAINEPAEVIAGFTYNSNQCLTGNNYCFTNTGTTGANYFWNFGDGGNSTLENPCYTYAVPGFYNVTQSVTVGACSDLASLPVIVYSKPTVTFDSTDISCFGACDGSAIPTVTGGTPPFTYLWLPGGNGLNLCPGTYCLTVTDSNGCSDSACVTITEPPLLVVSISSSSNIDCFGNCNGSATVGFTGGTAPYSFAWSDGQNAQTAINLCPGTYCVTVTDSNGCSDTACVTITEPPKLTITITLNNVTCFDACDGTTTVTVLGGTTPYTYQWNDPFLQITPTADSLCNGFYNVVVTDTNGCIITANALIQQPQELSLTISSITPSICSLPNGGACVNVLGGASPYVIQWNDSNNTIGVCIDSVYAGVYNPVVTDANSCTDTLPVIINDIPSPVIDSILTSDDNCYGNCIGSATVLSVTGIGPFGYYWTDSIGDTLNSLFIGENAINNLCAEIYMVTVVDVSTGCVTSGVFTISKPPPLNSTAFSSNPVSCYGFCDGDAFVSVEGGTPPYTYLWSNGDVAPLADSLCTGMHFVSIVDSLGCSDTSNVIITQPDSLQINPTVTDVSCFGGCDGAIFLNASGGTPSYTYNFTSGLCAGTYNDTVTDLNGCIRSQTITVNEPSLLTATGSTVPSTCGNANGEATVSPSGGIPPYTYLWNDPDSQITGAATGLLAGSYDVTITDSNDCTFIFPVSVSDLPGAIIDSISTTDVTCNGICDGTSTTSVSGGTPSLSYSWNTNPVQTTLTATGLCAVTSIITVTDFNGCITIDSVTINEPDILVAITSGDTTICNGDNTQISATASGGIGAYTYSWDNGLPDTTIHTVSPGSTTTYTVTVTDGSGCTDSNPVTVMIYAPLLINFADTLVCLGNAITISADVTGGCGNYSYQWSTGDMIDPITITPAITTVYSVIVNDGCCSPPMTDSIVVGTVGGPAPTVNLGADTTICDGNSIILDAGTGPFSYSWSTGSNNQTIVVNTSGTYYASVTDTINNVCTGSDTINVIVEICSGIGKFKVFTLSGDHPLGWQVYPNPNTGEFVIEMLVPKAQDVQIKIINVLGQEVYMEIIATSNIISRKRIDLASYPRGIYTLQIITDEGVFNKKVIVE